MEKYMRRIRVAVRKQRELMAMAALEENCGNIDRFHEKDLDARGIELLKEEIAQEN